MATVRCVCVSVCVDSGMLSIMWMHTVVIDDKESVCCDCGVGLRADKSRHESTRVS